MCCSLLNNIKRRLGGGRPHVPDKRNRTKGPSEWMLSWHLHYVLRWRSVSIITRVIIESIVLRQPRGDAYDTWSFCVIKWETEAEKEIKRAGNTLLGSSQMLQVSIETPPHFTLFSIFPPFHYLFCCQRSQ